MRVGRRRAAVRNAIIGLVLAAILPGAPALADDFELLLPLVTAIALGASGTAAMRSAPARPGALSFLPSQLHIPDGYAVDLEPGPSRSVGAIDRDRLVSVDLLPDSRRGWMPTIAIDEEHRGPLAGSGMTVVFLAEHRF